MYAQRREYSPRGASPWSLVQDSSVVATICISPSGEIKDANQTMLTLLGVDSMATFKTTEFTTGMLSSKSDWDVWEKALASGATRDIEISLRDKRGQQINLRGDITRVARHDGQALLYGVFVDTTAARQLQSGLQRAARMEVVGSLTSGIAHDFNNLLTVLVGNLYLVAEGVRQNPDLFEKAKRARDAAKRGADLTRQILNFARNEGTEAARQNPRRLIEDLKPLLQRASGSEIVLETRIDSETVPAAINGAQLDSIIVNLTLNARDALNGRGTVKITACNVALDKEKGANVGLPPGQYVQISVTDNGPGIPDAIREKVFEPFFTTKSNGEGTGLGLSMVRWLAEQAGGAVVLQTRPGRGTKVSLLLPPATRAASETAIQTMPLATLPTGDERVALLARHEELRSTIQQTLEVLGYSVRLLDDERALEDLFGMGATAAIDLLMVDGSALVNTGVDRLHEELARCQTPVRVIVISDAKSVEFASSAWGELVKPFSLFELATVTRQMLDGGANA